MPLKGSINEIKHKEVLQSKGELALNFETDSILKSRDMFLENSIKTYILSREKQITSLGWMHETSARAWCTGKTQRDWVERKVGGGIGRRNTCKSMADSCQCMTKPTTIL